MFLVVLAVKLALKLPDDSTVQTAVLAVAGIVFIASLGRIDEWVEKKKTH